MKGTDSRMWLRYAATDTGELSSLKVAPWNIANRSVTIFDDQEQVSRKVLARFSDVCGKQFSSLGANRERITGFLRDAVKNNG